jgi:phenylacetate-CoA ligase
LPDEKVVKQIVAGIKHTMLVSSSVELLEPGTLPRSERKTKRIFDQRVFE